MAVLCGTVLLIVSTQSVASAAPMLVPFFCISRLVRWGMFSVLKPEDRTAFKPEREPILPVVSTLFEKAVCAPSGGDEMATTATNRPK
jgi:hypothetical protein